MTLLCRMQQGGGVACVSRIRKKNNLITASQTCNNRKNDSIPSETNGQIITEDMLTFLGYLQICTSALFVKNKLKN